MVHNRLMSILFAALLLLTLPGCYTVLWTEENYLDEDFAKENQDVQTEEPIVIDYLYYYNPVPWWWVVTYAPEPVTPIRKENITRGNGDRNEAPPVIDRVPGPTRPYTPPSGGTVGTPGTSGGTTNPRPIIITPPKEKAPVAAEPETTKDNTSGRNRDSSSNNNSGNNNSNNNSTRNNGGRR